MPRKGSASYALNNANPSTYSKLSAVIFGCYGIGGGGMCLDIP